MAIITLDINNTHVARVVAALCATGGYNGVQTAQARQEFARQQIKKLILQTVREYEAPGALQAVSVALDADVNSIVIT